MATKKPTHTVKHKKQYLMVDGKLQLVPAGTDIVLDLKAANGLESQGKILKIGEKDSVDLTGDDSGATTVASLKEALTAKGIEFDSKANKADLEKLLAGSEKDPE